MKSITLKGEDISPADLMDRSMDQIRTAWLALQSSALSDDDALIVANVLNDAMRALEPVRDAIASKGAV